MCDFSSRACLSFTLMFLLLGENSLGHNDIGQVSAIVGANASFVKKIVLG